VGDRGQSSQLILLRADDRPKLVGRQAKRNSFVNVAKPTYRAFRLPDPLATVIQLVL